MKEYPTSNEIDKKILEEPLASYGAISMYEMAARGITKAYIKRILDLSGLSVLELIEILPISIDTYKRKVQFSSMVTEKVLAIEEVYRTGLRAFGDSFYDWMDTSNAYLGDIKPKAMLTNSFGVRRLLEEIGRIEHGVLA